MNRTSSILIIIAFNSIPIVGVAFYNWSVFEMFWLFWVETLIIAFFNSIRVLYSQDLNPAQATGERMKYNIYPAIRYMIGRIFIFLFYSIFIIIFIGLVANSRDGKMDIVKTIAFLNPLFNLALILCICSQVYYLVRYFFLSNAFRNSSPSQYPVLFDGRQIVMHVAVVLGAVGSAFLFKDQNVAHYASIWIIAVLCVCKTVYEFYALQVDQPVLLN